MKKKRTIMICAFVALISVMMILTSMPTVPTVSARSNNQFIHNPDEDGQARHPAVDSLGTDVRAVYTSLNVLTAILNVRTISSPDSGVTWPVANRIWISPFGNNQDFPDIKIDPLTGAGAGTVHFVWQENINGRWEIWYRWWDPAALPPIWGLRTQLSSPAAVGDALYPKVAAYTDTNLNINFVHVVWQEDIISGPVTSYEIKWAQSNNGGVSFLIPGGIVSGEDNVESIHPAITLYQDVLAPTAPRGAIVWEAVSSPHEIWFYSIPPAPPNGQWAFQLSSDNDRDSIHPDVAGKGQEVHVVWIEVDALYSRIGEIWMRQSNFHGYWGFWNPEFNLQALVSPNPVPIDTESWGPAIDYDIELRPLPLPDIYRIAVAYIGYPSYNRIGPNPPGQNTELYCMIGNRFTLTPLFYTWSNEIQETFTDGLQGRPLCYEHYPDVACEYSLDSSVPPPPPPVTDMWAHMVYDRCTVAVPPPPPTFGVWYIREP